jgi:hypothetical protein
MTNPSHITTPSNGDPPSDTVCLCGHATDEHDPIASRYCKATIESSLTRACMCVRVSAPLYR